MIVKIELELLETKIPIEEMETKLKWLWDSSQSRELSSFNLLLMRISKANAWDLRKLEVIESGNKGST